MIIELKGYCPVQKREYVISTKVLSKPDRLVGRVQCEYSRPPHECFVSPCPIVNENGYHH